MTVTTRLALFVPEKVSVTETTRRPVATRTSAAAATAAQRRALHVGPATLQQLAEAGGDVAFAAPAAGGRRVSELADWQTRLGEQALRERIEDVQVERRIEEEARIRALESANSQMANELAAIRGMIERQMETLLAFGKSPFHVATAADVAGHQHRPHQPAGVVEDRSRAMFDEGHAVPAGDKPCGQPALRQLAAGECFADRVGKRQAAFFGT